MEKVLIVEDELPLARLLELELIHAGYETETAHDGKAGLALALEKEYDFVLLDLMLPQMNGIEVCRRLRQAKKTPVLMLTARDSVIDRVNGLDSGADDYINKPFAIEELLARLRSIKRRVTSMKEEGAVQVSDLVLDPLSRQVTRSGHSIDLTGREFELLQCLMENNNKVMTREALLNLVWGYDYMGETNVVDVYIRYVRVKVDDGHSRKLIHTVRGMGYILRDQE